MNIIKRLCSFIVIAFVLFILAACGGSKSGVEAEMSYTASRGKIIIDVIFNDNENLKSGDATPHIKLYQVDEDGEETYKNQDVQMEFKNDVYTNSSVTFSDLEFDTKYKFYLYITFNGKDESAGELTAKTLASGNTADNATVITSKEDFLSITNDPDGYYSLDTDIDFGGETLDVLFTATSNKQFKGTFDGNGHTIKNFKLKSESNIGVFGYTNGATIKNLNISDVIADFSTGRSTCNLGVLIGSANRTTIENCTVSNVQITIQGNTTAELNVGGVIGVGEDLAVNNVKSDNISIKFTRARLKVSTGLFAGKIKGSGLGTDGKLIDSCSSAGTIDINCHYPSNEGYTYAGGFIGNVGSSSMISNSYSIVDIVVGKSKNQDDNFNLSIGGFVGINNEGSINLNGCLAVADITGYAGTTPEEGSTADYSTEVMCTKNAYFGGFAGKTVSLFKKIENCAYVIKDKGINVSAATNNSKDEQYLYVDEVIGLNTDNPNKVVNVFSSADENADFTIFNSAILTAVNQYLNK